MKTAECIIIAIVLINVHANDRRISDKRLCGDPTCTHPVSLAKTLINYVSDDARLLSFGKNVNIAIYSKSAGSKPDLWGAEIKGKRGYVPKGFVREYKILKSSLTYIVDTEVKEEKSEKSKDSENQTNTPSILGSIGMGKNVISNTETAQLKSDEGSGREDVLGKTPPLEDAVRHSVYADTSFSSFPGSGVSAEPLESETAPKPEDIPQPYEVIDGTTISYGTDGRQSEMKDTTQQDVITQSPEINAKSDDPSVHSPDGDILTTEIPNSNEIINNNNNNEDGVVTTEIEESSGHIYQYMSSWISEGSGNVEEAKSEDEEGTEEEEEEEEEDEEEEEEEEKGESDENSEHNVPKKDEILISIQKNEESKAEEESKDEIDKEESDISQEVNKESKSEGNEVESKSKEDLVQTSTGEEVDDKAMKDKEVSEEMKNDSVVQDVKEISDTEKEVDVDKNNEENSPNEEKTESVSTVATEETPGDSLEVGTNDDGAVSDIDREDLNEEISSGRNESEVEEVKKITQESGDIEHEASSANISENTNVGEVNNTAGSTSSENVEHSSEIQSSSLNIESINDSLEKKSRSDDINSEFLQTEGVKATSEATSANENENKYEVSTEESQIDTENISETVTSSSKSEEIVSSVEEFTETSISEELQIPIYESSVESITVPSTDVSSDSVLEKKEDGMLIEEISAESPEGYIPWVTGFLTGLFSSSSSSENVSEDGNESEVEDAAEDIFTADDSEKITRKREAEFTSIWEMSHGHGDSEFTPAGSCKKPSLGSIDTECNDMAGKEPDYIYNTRREDSSVVKEAEDDALAMDLQKSFDIIICLVITGATVIIFCLGYLYLEKKRRDGSLIAKINELEKALLVSSKECIILRDDLEATKEKLSSVEISSVDSNETANSLNLEIEKYKMINAELEEQVASLEKELENATEAGLELNRMLSDFLSSQNSSETMMKSVEHLQKQLDSQQNTITSLTKSLNAKTMENESLQSDLNSALEKVNVLQDDVETVNEHLKSVLSEKLKAEEEINERNKLLDMQLSETSAKKNAEIADLRKEITNLQETVSEQKDNIVTKETEVLVLQDCLKHLKSLDDEEGHDKLHALLDVGHIKAELKILTIERDTLAEKLQGEEDARKLLEDHMKIVNEELSRLRENYEEADKEKTEAQTRLQVLSNYFKEKETQLQKELGLQEAICLQKEGDATSTYEQIKYLHDEIENYRSQNDTLKKEILDQERGLKCQIASLEKKAHENWVAARQMERKLEESKQEAGQLRNRLTVVEKNVTNNSMNSEPSKMSDRLTGDSNGELPTSPVHLGISLEDSSSSPQIFQHHDGLPSTTLVPTILPGPMMPPNPFVGLPPPGVFMPPPPPPPVPQSPGAPYMPPPLPLFPDRRPPPLGRMSSPPPPDPRGTFSPYDDCSPPPSPLPIRYRSPPPLGDESFRQHRTPPPPSHFKVYSSPAWDDPHGPTRSGFRPLPPSERRNSPRESKGPALSSGHSSDSLEKSSRHSGRV